MLFTSHAFLLWFLPIFLSCYYAIKGSIKYQNLVIIFFSSLFYASFGLTNLAILYVTLIYDYVIGNVIYVSSQSKVKVGWLIFSIFVNLGLLCYFKYSVFALATVSPYLSSHISFVNKVSALLPLVAPVGISFITFQRISYLVDIYKNKISPSKSFVEYVVYAVLFPHLLSGPIVRFSYIKDQLKTRIINADTIFAGFKYFTLGLFIKVFAADKLILLVNFASQDLSNLSFAYGWTIVLAYSLRIYADFSSYSLIAIGIAKLIGFNFPRNFNKPYLATSFGDFWNKWNITLSLWLRDYLFIPLGGSRRGILRTLLNVIITMALGGLWHGANWNFILWGFLHGLYLCVEHILAWRQISFGLNINIKRLFVFLIVSVTWATFIYNDSTETFKVYRGLLNVENLQIDTALVRAVINNLFAIILAIWWAFVDYEYLVSRVKGGWAQVFLIILVFLVCLYAMLWGSEVQFIYFQF